MRLLLGTRGSELARTQSGHVAAALEAQGHAVELVTIRSEGDVTTGSLLEAGGLGVFAAALRTALLRGEVDLAVHSLKDLPTAPVPGLVLAAIPPRAEHADVLCARDGLTLDALPAGARVGTGSPRRAAQLRVRRPDLAVVEIRGNVGTRLDRALGENADLDAVVLAGAGLARLGRADAATDVLDLLPAPGQGALAVECRADRADVVAALAVLDDPHTRACVVAERAVLARLGAGCAAPLGAHARVTDDTITLRAGVYSADGASSLGLERTVPLADAQAFGAAVADELLSRGAADVTPLGASRPSELEDFHTEQQLWAPGTEPALIGRRVLLPRADGALADAIRAAGADVDAAPLIRTEQLPFALPGPADWVVLTSPAAVSVLVEAGLEADDLADRVAAVGPGTATALQDAGWRVDLVPEGPSNADTLLTALVAADPATDEDGAPSAILPCSALASPRLAAGLTDAGWDVDVVPTYTTVTVDAVPEGVRPWADYDAILLTSGSVARAVLDLLGRPEGVRVVAFGHPTASACVDLGLPVDAVAPTQDGPGAVTALTACLKETR